MNNKDCNNFIWDVLLEQIDNKNVIPVIGQGVYWVRTGDNKDVLLYHYLAEKLAKEMGLPLPKYTHHAFAKSVFQYLEKKPNDYPGLQRFIMQNLSSLYPTPAGPLWKLVRIKPFSLFINTTYDHFIEYTLNAVRNYPARVFHHTYNENKTRNITIELLNKMEEEDSLSSMVLHSFGSAAINYFPAYTERDILETVVNFQINMVKESKNPFFQTLKEKSLLFIGCGYDDWLFRFFIRTIANKPFQFPGDPRAWKFISDDFDFYNYRDLKPFLRAYDCEVFYPGGCKDFVDILFEKVKDQYPQNIIIEEKFPGTAFVSFHSGNRSEAERLVSNLREDGIQVWLDQWSLKPGDDVSETIVKAIDKCPVFIPLISETSKQLQKSSDIVKYHIREWEWAYSRHLAGENPRYIIPVIIDDTGWMYEAFKKYVFFHIPNGNRIDDYKKLRNDLLSVGNSYEMPPLEIVTKGKDAVNDYFQSLKEGEDLPLNEVKVLILGEGGVGKTSLVKCLLDEKFNENEEETPGININLWTFKDKKSETEVRTRIWDFGGQEIMHATHQFFLSKRCLYILVLDGRYGEKPGYWLKYIESFGGDSPVLVVLNKIDVNPGFKVNQKHLKEKHKNIKKFFRISCKTKQGIASFMSGLKNILLNVGMLKTKWPPNWFNVKIHLEKISKSFISYEEYRGICIDEKIEDEKIQTTLLEFLHDLGIIVHYPDIDLEDTYVLDPQWVTEGVYKIINSKKIAVNKGILKLDSLSEILKDDKEIGHKYPLDKYRYLIQLMKKFELCYKIDKKNILITDLMEEEEKKVDFNYDGAIKFIFEYDFLPKSVMHRFIVRLHRYIKDELLWSTGVVLEDKVFKSTALVKTEGDRRIIIYVNGEKKQYYLVFIQHTFRDIHDSFTKLKVIEQGPFGEEAVGTVIYGKGEGSFDPGGAININKLHDISSKDELITIASNIAEKRATLAKLWNFIYDESTTERQIHKILESNWWMMGIEYSMMSSDKPLKSVVENFLGKKYKGENPGVRPDLLLFEEIDRRYLLIELKRPGHSLELEDETQALKYMLELKKQLSDMDIDIILIGGRITNKILPHKLRPNVKFLTYTVLLKKAERNLEWVIRGSKKGM